jgi:hypothetical protein
MAINQIYSFFQSALSQLVVKVPVMARKFFRKTLSSRRESLSLNIKKVVV